MNIKMKKQNRKYNEKENLCTLNKKTGLVTNTKKRVKKYNGNKKNIFIIIYICTLVNNSYMFLVPRRNTNKLQQNGNSTQDGNISNNLNNIKSTEKDIMEISNDTNRNISFI